MVPPPSDPFKPAPGATYTKGDVNRAGDCLRAWYTDPSVSRQDLFPGEWTLGRLTDALTVLSWWRYQHARPLAQVSANLRYYVANPGPIIIAQRLKRRNTILDKLAREPRMDLAQMADIAGVRARLGSTHDIYRVSRRLRKNWTVIKTRDYIASPKPSGYRAMHLIVRRAGYLVEVQLRTRRQDAWANQVEEDSRRVSTDFKSGRGAATVHDYYVLVSEVLALQDAAQPIPPRFVDELRASRLQAQEFLRPADQEGST